MASGSLLRASHTVERAMGVVALILRTREQVRVRRFLLAELSRVTLFLMARARWGVLLVALSLVAASALVDSAAGPFALPHLWAAQTTASAAPGTVSSPVAFDAFFAAVAAACAAVQTVLAS